MKSCEIDTPNGPAVSTPFGAVLLQTVLTYNPETGLTWLARPRMLFASDHEYRRWNTRYSGTPALAGMGNGYRHGFLFNTIFYQHRVVFAMVNGYWPDHVDHDNGDKLDNSPANLRSVTPQQNAQNRKMSVKNTSGETNICWDKGVGKWSVQVGGRVHGYFADMADAVKKRDIVLSVMGYHRDHGKRQRSA